MEQRLQMLALGHSRMSRVIQLLAHLKLSGLGPSKLVHFLDVLRGCTSISFESCFESKVRSHNHSAPHLKLLDSQRPI